MKTVMFIALLSLVGCSTARQQRAPSSNPPPLANTGNITAYVDDIDAALKNASTRTARIQILVDALSFKDIILAEKK